MLQTVVFNMNTKEHITMKNLLQILLTMLGICVWQSCHGSPLSNVPNADNIQYNDVVNTFLNYLTSNTNLSITTTRKDSSSRYCPWRYVTNNDVNRFPVSIVFAELTVDDDRCLGAPGNSRVDYFCEYINKSVSVLTKTCTFCPFQKQVINVPVGSRCVGHPIKANYNG